MGSNNRRKGGPRKGFDISIGPLCQRTWDNWLQPAFAAYCQQRNPHELLVLADRLLDALEVTAEQTRDDALGRTDPGHPAIAGRRSRAQEAAAAFDRLQETALRFIDLAERSEDEGYQGASLTSSSVGDVLLEAQENFLMALIQESAITGRLIGPPDMETGTANRPSSITSEILGIPRSLQCTVKRSYLQFWLLTAVEPGFVGGHLPPTADFLKALSSAQGKVPMLHMIAGDWTRWPSFDPGILWAPDTSADPASELAPANGWTIRTAAETRQIAAQLALQLRRFVHLEFLRVEEPEVWRDARQAYGDPADMTVLDGYTRLIEAQPWSDDHEWCWRYLVGEVDEPPQRCVVPALTDLPAAVADRHARDVLEVLRELYEVVALAATSGEGLYAMMH